MSIAETEAASAAVAKNPNGRVKLADIEGFIEWEFSSSLAALTNDSRFDPMIEQSVDIAKRLSLVTVHVAVLRNGFVVVGKSAPMDPANYNAALGAKFAREDAIRQIWPLMAFARLSAASAT